MATDLTGQVDRPISPPPSHPPEARVKCGDRERPTRFPIRGLPSMTSALEGGRGSGRVDKSTDKLRDHYIIVGPDLPEPGVHLTKSPKLYNDGLSASKSSIRPMLPMNQYQMM